MMGARLAPPRDTIGAMAARRLLLAFLAWAMVVGAASDAAGDERIRREAERRNRIGTQFYNSGSFEQALQMYQGAYDLQPDVRYLFNIALAKEKMFDYEGCVVALQGFLRSTEGDSARRASRENAGQRLALCLERVTIPVRFTSVPTNAAIFRRDGEARTLLGRTPQELPLPPGRHALEVEMPGYVTQRREVVVAVGERAQPDFVLEKLSSLRIEVDPSGARISVDSGEWEPAPLERQLEAGTYQVRVEKDGYEPAQRKLVVEPGAALSLVLPLRPLPTIRTLGIALGAGAAGDARVVIDGRARGRAPLEVALSPGTHRVRVTAAGWLPYADTIVVPEERDARLVVDLRQTRSSGNRIALWSLAGATGAATIAGSVFGTLALVDQRRFDDDPTNPNVHERGERRAETADALFVTAAVLAAGTVVYYLLTRPGRSRATLE